eukprot:gene1119-1454_t
MIDNGQFYNHTIGSVLKVTGNSSVELRQGSSIHNVSGLIGAGIMADTAAVTLIRSSIEHCSTEDSGGAIAAQGAARINITDSWLARNHAMQDGGAIVLRDSSSLRASYSSAVSNNAKGGWGGAAMLNQMASINSSNCRWVNNSAGQEGGLLSAFTDRSEDRPISALFINDTVIGNNATNSGGAINARRTAAIILQDTEFADNWAGKVGGALSVMGSCRVQMTNCTIRDNTAGDVAGGLGLWDSAEMSIEQCNITHNRAKYGGGGIGVFGSGVLNVTGSILAQNLGSQGGALRIWDSASSLVVHSQIHFNIAVDSGGGIWLDGRALVTLQHSNITHNRAGSGASGDGDTDCGGGLHIKGTSKAALVAVVVAHNAAGSGGGICLKSADAKQDQPDNAEVKFQNHSQLLSNVILDPGGSGADIQADPAALLIMPADGCNLMPNSTSVSWIPSCIRGYTLDAGQGRCRACAAPTYLLDGGGFGVPCMECKAAAECHGGAVIAAKDGFWHTDGSQGGSVATCKADDFLR